MNVAEIVLQVWTSLVGVGFFLFYHHPKVERHPAFFWTGMALVGYALSRHFFLRLSEWPYRSGLLAMQYLCLVAGIYFMVVSVKIALIKR